MADDSKMITERDAFIAAQALGPDAYVEKAAIKVGVKFDAGKPEIDLLPYGPLAWIARAMEYGRRKYELDNWKLLGSSADLRRVRAAMGRHVLKFISGEWADKESKLPHLAHIGANIVFLLWHWSAQHDIDDDVLDTEQQAAMQRAQEIGDEYRAKQRAGDVKITQKSCVQCGIVEGSWAITEGGCVEGKNHKFEGG